MNQKQTKLYCFSPPVMLATFVVEIGLLLHVLVRYKLSRVTRLAGSILLLLATFQLAEYYVCGGLGLNAAQWSKVGYLAITALPPLGLHFTRVISGKSMGKQAGVAYVSAIIMGGIFLLPWAFEGHICAGNYVIFQLTTPIGVVYTAYYYFWLLAGIATAYRLAKAAKPKVQRALYAQILGYASFMVPTAIVNTLKPETTLGLPSIMCGFAVLYALTVVYAILPAVQRKSSRPRKLDTRYI